MTVQPSSRLYSAVTKYWPRIAAGFQQHSRAGIASFVAAMVAALLISYAFIARFLFWDYSHVPNWYLWSVVLSFIGGVASFFGGIALNVVGIVAVIGEEHRKRLFPVLALALNTVIAVSLIVWGGRFWWSFG